MNARIIGSVAAVVSAIVHLYLWFDGVKDQGTVGALFVVNVLAARQEQVARRFSIVDIDRFEGVGFTRSSHSYAILDDALAVIECSRVSMCDGGDHTIILGEVEATRAESGTPLLYYRGGYAQLER